MRVSHTDLSELCVALEAIGGLVELDLSTNYFGDAGCGALTQLLKKSSSLLKLNVSNNGIQVEGTKRLASAIKHCE